MIHRHEHRGVAFVDRHRAGQVRAPHLVGVIGDDRAVVSLGAVGMTNPPRGLQAVLFHEPTHAFL